MPNIIITAPVSWSVSTDQFGNTVMTGAVIQTPVPGPLPGNFPTPPGGGPPTPWPTPDPTPPPPTSSGALPLPNQTRVPSGPFGKYPAMVSYVFQTGDGKGTSLGTLSIYEFGGLACQRAVCISKTQGDMSQPAPAAQWGNVDPSYTLAVGYPGTPPYYVVNLDPNSTYYINVTNQNAQGQNTSNGNNPIAAEMSLPT